MNRETRHTVTVLAVVSVVMLAVPLSYRVWLHYHPQQARPQQPAAEILAKMVEKRAMRLLQTPPSRWTEAERRSEPKIHAWLVDHAKTILPWEWTDEARSKDPAGYRRLWLGLLRERKGALTRRLKDGCREEESIRRELETMRTIHAHRTNQVSRIREQMSTNGFPVSVKVERLSKGRFWGWNTKIEEVRFESREDFDGEGAGWLAAELKTAADEASAMEGRSAARERIGVRIEAIKDLLSGIEALEGSTEIDDGICLPEMCRSIRDEPDVALAAGQDCGIIRGNQHAGRPAETNMTHKGEER